MDITSVHRHVFQSEEQARVGLVVWVDNPHGSITMDWRGSKRDVQEYVGVTEGACVVKIVRG